MSRRVVLGALLALVGAVATVRAQAPWGDLLGMSRVEADAKKAYDLKEDNGPWLIMACSFSGPNAQQQAHDLALELRSRYKLEAFVHTADFKLDDPNGGRDQNPFSHSPHWRYKKFKDHPEIEEIAVLVGNYPAIDSPDAKKALQQIRYAQPECLRADDGKGTSRTLAALRTIQQNIQNAMLPDGSEKKKRGPMGHAFVTTNPLLPADYYAPKKGIDPLILRMNKGVEHSLLDCPGKYTVQIAHFTGNVVINQREIEQINNGKPMKSSLTQADEKAHALTVALRTKGYEAYEFHDRFASIVTVGSFNSVGTPRSDGKIEINPMIHQLMQVFAAKPMGGELVPKQVIGILCDIQPIPVEVPKRSISRELAQRQ
ncbi:MAG: hypothetical protein ACLQLG_14960 [Thermoguttaceae bacterium]